MAAWPSRCTADDATPCCVVRSVSAIFPCYNDEPTIGGLVDDVHAALCPLVAEVEVIVVNDGSADGRVQLLDRLADDRPWLRVDPPRAQPAATARR